MARPPLNDRGTYPAYPFMIIVAMNAAMANDPQEEFHVVDKLPLYAPLRQIYTRNDVLIEPTNL